MSTLAYYSDLHLEGSNIDLSPGSASVIAFTGDIMAPQIGDRLDRPDSEHEGVWWLKTRMPDDRPVLVVPGNHDYEGTRFPDALAAMRRSAEGSQVIVLCNDAITIDGVRYIGSPLWSDPTQGRADPQDILEAVGLRTDLRRARDGEGRPLTGQWLIKQREQARRFIQQELEQHRGVPTVVLTHWAPSPRSQDFRFRGEDTSGYWACDCEDLVQQASLWVHGHIHDKVNYQVGDDPLRGHVRANPRGFSKIFGATQNPWFDPNGAPINLSQFSLKVTRRPKVV